MFFVNFYREHDIYIIALGEW